MATNSAQILRSSLNQAEPDSDSNLALHMKFRNLTLLLRLLTTINQGNATLPATDAPPIQNLPVRRKVDAVTTILVHNEEVLAATAYASSGSLVVAGTMPTEEAHSEDDDYSVTTPYTNQWLNIAAVANPERSNSAKGIRLASGKDLWSGFDPDDCWKLMRK
jgi:hypothetical protein